MSAKPLADTATPVVRLTDLYDDITLASGQITTLSMMIARICEHVDDLADDTDAIVSGLGYVAEHVVDLQEQVADKAKALYALAREREGAR